MAAEPRPGSAGLAYHAGLETAVLVHRRRLGHVAVMAEHFFRRRELWPALARLKCFLPVVAHGVGLSLGSAEGLDRPYVADLLAFLDFLRPAWFGEHIAFTRAGGRDLGHLGPLPFNAEAVGALAANVRGLRPELPCPLILENISTPFALPGSTWSEPEFVTRVLDATGCGLLLDLHNLHADAVNQGFDAAAALGALPLERVVEVHLAGGYREGRWLVDSHTRPVPEEVFALLARVAASGARPAVTLEWDRELPPFERLLAPIERAARILAAAPAPGTAPVRAALPAVEAAAEGGLGELQRDFVAAALEPGRELAGVAAEAMGHYASSLARKRAAEGRARKTGLLARFTALARH